MSHRLLYAVGLTAALAVAGPARPSAAQSQGEGALVRVDAVGREEVRQRRTVIGRIEPARRSTVAAEQSGRIVQAPPEPGLPVQEGQVLAKIDDSVLRAELAAAQAAVAEAESGIHEAQALSELSHRNLHRLEELQSRRAAEEFEVADARNRAEADLARLDVARALLSARRAELELIELRLRKTQVLAPFAGFTVAKGTELGQWVEPGDPISEVVEIGRVKVRLNVPQELLPHIDPDEPITVSIDALNVTREAPLFSVIPEADPQSRTFDLLLKLDNPDGRVKPGMSVLAELPTGRVETALTVPRNAVQSTPTGAVVYADRDGTAALVPVVVRFGHGDRFVIEGDLRDGEKVVVEGNERLRPGQPLKVLGEGPR